MTKLRALCLFLAWSFGIASFPPYAHAQAGQPGLTLGPGAQFLPANAFLYVSADTSTESRLVDMVRGLLPSPDTTSNAHRLQSAEYLRRFGFDPAFNRVTGSWMSGEIFWAMPSANDLSGLVSMATGEIDLDCEDPGFLFGVRIGDRAAFTRFVGEWAEQTNGTGSLAERSSYNGTDILWVRDNPESSGLFAAVSGDYLLLGSTRGHLIDALDMRPAESLASSPKFREALNRFPRGAFAHFYATVPSELPASIQAVTGPISAQAGATSADWLSGALSVTDNQIRIDLDSSPSLAGLTTNQRALLGKPANPLRSVSAAPASSLAFVGIDNLKLMVDVLLESLPDRSGYDQAREQSIAASGIDPDEDLLSWMTGELAVFVAPAADLKEASSQGIGLGLVIEVKDRARVQQKLDKIFAAIESLGLAPATQTIAGVPFRRVPLGSSDAVFVGMTDGWVFLTNSAEQAAQSVAGVRARGGLATQREFANLRGSMPTQMQSLAYFDLRGMFQLSADMTQDENARIAAEALGGLMVGGSSSLTRSDSTLVMRVNVPAELPDLFAGSSTPTRESTVSTLIDASKSPALATALQQRHPLKDYLGRELGARRIDVVSPPERIGRSADAFAVQPREKLLVRTAGQGYGEAEIAAYQSYVRCGGTVIMLSSAQPPGQADTLAAGFGMEARGAVRGQGVVDWYEEHQAVVGAPKYPMGGGTALVSWDDYTQPLGYLSTGSYLDLNGNGVRDGDEPADAPAIALRRYGRGNVVFIGSSALIDEPDHALHGQLFDFLFGRSARFGS
jgi:hypothetical protein